MERLYQGNALDNQNVERRDSSNWRSIANKILLIGALTGLAALAKQTDLPKRAMNTWYNTASVERSTPANNYVSVHYTVRSGDTIGRLVKDDPQIESYLKAANKIKDDKDLKSK